MKEVVEGLLEKLLSVKAGDTKHKYRYILFHT